MHGRVRISFFGDMAFTVHRPEQPITLIVERGRVDGDVSLETALSST